MWVVHVTRLVVSNWRTWLRVIPLALVVVALTVSSGITNARQLSDEQKNIASYGSTSGLFSLQEDVPPGTPVPIPRNNTLQASAPFPQLYSNINLVQYDDVAYQEMPMAGSATQGRYRLTSGRWPAKAGEVLATSTLGADDGSRLSAKAGDLHLTVTGHVEAVYDRAATLVLAAPGTWQSWRISRDDAGRAGIRGNGQIGFTSQEPGDVCSLLAETLKLAGDCDTTQTRSASEAHGLTPKAFVDQNLAWLVFGLLGAVVSGAALTALLRRIASPLLAIGVRRRSVSAMSKTVALLVAETVSLMSVALGQAVVAAARWYMAPRASAPLGPWRFPAVPLVMALVIGVLPAAMVNMVPSRRKTVKRRGINMNTARRLGWAALVLGCAVCLWGLLGADATFTAVAVVAGMCAVAGGLGAPFVLSRLVRTHRPVGRALAAHRALSSRGGWHCVFAGVAAGLVTATATGLLIVSALFSQANAQTSTGMPPGMALLHVSMEGVPALESAQVKQFSDALEGAKNITVHQVDDANISGSWWYFSKVDDVAVVTKLDDAQRDVLVSGGYLTNDPSRADPAHTVGLTDDLSWVKRISVRPKAGIPRGAGSAILFTGLTPDQDRLTNEWAQAHGLGEFYVMAPRILGDVPLPTITIVATVTFIVLSAIMAGLLAKEERAANSDLVTSLKRIGLGRRWVDQVILVEVATTMLAALICGVISSVVAVWLTGRILSGALDLLGAAWWVFGALAAGMFGGSLLGAAIHRRYHFDMRAT
ncbi:hypothetical protein A9Y99_08345 [Cutibacterium acnes]|uniref:hypothetical protein n=1 Tax=Cutibacterium acnes TaxID=1747 RepID=UPI0007E5025E|nr:hypothetical protein [Cutibacterium acnes]OAX90020.1 hypothetical protein A9Y83_00390 [Cutibacterium acnes]OAY09241.1 hypothetical protein A9Y99_08345 [Cutibacterium acnes]